MSDLPKDVSDAFSAVGGVGCTFALMPTESGQTELGVVVAVPINEDLFDPEAVSIHFQMGIHLMTQGVVIRALISITGLDKEIMDMDILVNPLDKQQASALTKIGTQSQIGFYIYQSTDGNFAVGKTMTVDDAMRSVINTMLEEANDHSALIPEPNFQAAVKELAAQPEE